jgi:carbon monoxide dehydrogenase subunit G
MAIAFAQGPTTAAYAGKLELTEIDEAAHRVTMSANGRDKRGQGSAKATITSAMSASAGTTHVDVTTDFNLTGRLARVGRGGMIEDGTNRLVGEFVDCRRGSLESPAAEPAGEASAAPTPQARPIRGGRLFLAVLWGRIKRLFGGGRGG